MRFFAACILFLLLGFASCKSKKAQHKNNLSKKTEHRNELKKLSEKLNLNLTEKDNIELYQQIAYWLGTPHKMGNCTKSGIDCSCFVRLVIQDVYQKELPRTAAEMHEKSNLVEQHKLKEGDLVFFKIKSKKVSHVGIFLKEGWFAHVSTSRGVMINNLSETYYKQYFDGAGRY